MFVRVGDEVMDLSHPEKPTGVVIALLDATRVRVKFDLNSYGSADLAETALALRID
jgi:hypothetical protein